MAAIFICGIILWIASTCQAGNREMAKTRMQALDRINKHVVSKVPDIPQYGKINIQADIHPDGGTVRYKVYDRKKETETKGIIHFSEPDTNSSVNVKTRIFPFQ
jgi:hypothetical protein